MPKSGLGPGTAVPFLNPLRAVSSHFLLNLGREAASVGPGPPHLLRDLASFQFPLKVGLPPEKDKGEEEEVEEEDSLFNLCVPGIVTLQSPLHKTFRSTDTVGFVESELKKLLAVQRESRLWKMGSKEGRELLAQPEITLEEAGVVDGQHLLLEEMDEMGNWPPE
ncbi:putative gametogenetin-binding protein 1 [Loxodonta africana]|uniref:putative gametogenetin-binding protein 1 n=1 Tax=Loxodonta africana TaxID=9785 RepID=UPI0030D318A0